MTASHNVIEYLTAKPAMTSRRKLIIVAMCVVAFGLILGFTIPVFEKWRLEDFANTFYPAGNYLLRGENVYLNAYPHPTNGRQYPPYAPIWILYSVVPLSVFPMPVGEALRFLFDLALLPFLAYLAARWARVENVWLGTLLVLAPWHLTELSTGQWTVFVMLGIFLSYWGAKRANPMMTAAALWLLLAKPNIVALIVLATMIYAWRARIIFKTIVILGVLVTLSSLAQPSWVLDLSGLYLDRLAHPRPSDSILLLPGYPWSQLILLGSAGLAFLVYFWHRKAAKPTPLLWGILTCASLVGAPHTFVYDWQLLMLPLALMLNQRWGTVFAVILYLYCILWAILALGFSVPFPSPVVIPSLVLLAILSQAYLTMRLNRRTASGAT